MVIDFTKYTDKELMVGLWYGEARLIEFSLIEDIREILAIGHTVLNRINLPQYPKSVQGVILQGNQFSCFNPGDPNASKIKTFLDMKYPSETYKQYSVYAESLLKGLTRDFSGGADHYCARWFYEQAKPTHWCRIMKITDIHGGHIFLKEQTIGVH